MIIIKSEGTIQSKLSKTDRCNNKERPIGLPLIRNRTVEAVLGFNESKYGSTKASMVKPYVCSVGIVSNRSRSRSA